MIPYFEIHVNRVTGTATLTESFKKSTVVYHAFVGTCATDEYLHKETKTSIIQMRRMIKRIAKASRHDARNYVERIKF